MNSHQAELEAFDYDGERDMESVEPQFSELMGEIRNGLYKKKDFYGQGTQIVKMGELFDSEFITNQDDMDRLELTDKELEKHSLKEGDLLFARRSYVREGSGKCSIVSDLREPLVPESSIIRARPDQEKVEPEFIYYFFKSSIGRGRMDKIIRQTAVSGIAQSDLKEIQIPLPTLQEQEKIARTLRNFDDKIRVNERINQYLEEIARTLFRRIFIEYDNYENFKDSDVGKIPSSFSAAYLTDLINIVLGGTPDSDTTEYWGGDIVWAKAKDISNEQSAFISRTEENITEEGLEESSTEIAPKLSTIITARGTVGEIAMPSFDMAINQSCYSLVSDREEDRYFVYFLMDAILNNLMSRTHGTVFDTITKRTLNEQEIVLPPPYEREKFHQQVAPLMEMIQGNQSENKALKNIRDSLLPKLITGDVRLEDIPLEEIDPNSEE